MAIISASGMPPSFCGRASPSVRLCRCRRACCYRFFILPALPVRDVPSAPSGGLSGRWPGLGPGMPSLLIGRWCDRWATRASGDFVRVACGAESNSCHDGRYTCSPTTLSCDGLPCSLPCGGIHSSNQWSQRHLCARNPSSGATFIHRSVVRGTGRAWVRPKLSRCLPAARTTPCRTQVPAHAHAQAQVQARAQAQAQVQAFISENKTNRKARRGDDERLLRGKQHTRAQPSPNRVGRRLLPLSDGPTKIVKSSAAQDRESLYPPKAALRYGL